MSSAAAGMQNTMYRNVYTGCARDAVSRMTGGRISQGRHSATSRPGQQPPSGRPRASRQATATATTTTMASTSEVRPSSRCTVSTSLRLGGWIQVIWCSWL